MSDMTLPVQVHLFTVLPALMLGAINLGMTKGTPVHKLIGWIWVVLMLTTSLFSFGIQSEGRFSWLHLLSILSITSIVIALIAIRRHDRRSHLMWMIGAYAGMAVAGAFAVLMPGRVVYQYLFGL